MAAKIASYNFEPSPVNPWNGESAVDLYLGGALMDRFQESLVLSPPAGVVHSGHLLQDANDGPRELQILLRWERVPRRLFWPVLRRPLVAFPLLLCRHLLPLLLDSALRGCTLLAIGPKRRRREVPVRRSCGGVQAWSRDRRLPPPFIVVAGGCFVGPGPGLFGILELH
ncbi:hypothetical protein PG994_004712 [Apiospora phragmitis]|uniref:Uncharacterized protein n=1 Tax=Apiospora phragmitis TaxID=2905665 RepID=A0ABR1VRD6_9PEZI